MSVIEARAQDDMAADGGPDERRRAVLDAALALLVEDGPALTMTAVARRAACSKETLYKWFGGRDGLLIATVQWQAAKVRPVAFDPDALDGRQLAACLERFACDWLGVISGTTSVALNRLAIGGAGEGRGPDLGAIVLQNGPAALRRRLAPLLEAARAAGLLAFTDAGQAFGTFFGLVVRDLQIRLLLGDRPPVTGEALRAQAARATRQFLILHQPVSGAAGAGAGALPERT